MQRKANNRNLLGYQAILNQDSTRNLLLAQGTVFDESDNANSMGMVSPSKGTKSTNPVLGK